MTTWWQAVASLRAAREPGVLVTVTEVRGHAPREAGAKMVVSASSTWASIGGGNLEEEAVRRARELIDSARVGADVVHREPLRQGAVPARRAVLRRRGDRAARAAGRRTVRRDLRRRPRRPRAGPDPGPARPRPAPGGLARVAPDRRRAGAAGRLGGRGAHPPGAGDPRAGAGRAAARHAGAGADPRPRRGPRDHRRGAALRPPGVDRADRVVGEVGAVPVPAGRRRAGRRGRGPGRDADRPPGRDVQQGTRRDRRLGGRGAARVVRARERSIAASDSLPRHLPRHPAQPVHRRAAARGVRPGDRRRGRCDRGPRAVHRLGARRRRTSTSATGWCCRASSTRTSTSRRSARSAGSGCRCWTGWRSARCPRRPGSPTRRTPPRSPRTSSPAWRGPGRRRRWCSGRTSRGRWTRCSPRRPGSGCGSRPGWCCPTGSCARTCSPRPSAPTPRGSSWPSAGTARAGRATPSPRGSRSPARTRCWSRPGRCSPTARTCGSPRTSTRTSRRSRACGSCSAATTRRRTSAPGCSDRAACSPTTCTRRCPS